MKSKLFDKVFSENRFNRENRGLWKSGLGHMTARWEFVGSCVLPGSLNLDKSLVCLSDSLNLDNVDKFLAEYLLDSSDWNITSSISVFKGEGRHISNDLNQMDVILDEGLEDIEVLDSKFFSKVYGGFEYNDLFFEEEVDEEDLVNEEGFSEEDEDEEGEDVIEEPEYELDSFLSFSNTHFDNSKRFELLSSYLDSLTSFELNSLIKIESGSIKK